MKIARNQYSEALEEKANAMRILSEQIKVIAEEMEANDLVKELIATLPDKYRPERNDCKARPPYSG